MDKLLRKDLTLDYFESKFSNDLKDMYSNPASVPQNAKDKAKEAALSLSNSFKKTIIDFYFERQGINIDDQDFDILLNNFDRFLSTLLQKLDTLKTDRILYSTVAMMWTGILTQLEKESQVTNDIGLLMATQNLLIKYLKEQNNYYKSFKK